MLYKTAMNNSLAMKQLKLASEKAKQNKRQHSFKKVSVISTNNNNRKENNKVRKFVILGTQGSGKNELVSRFFGCRARVAQKKCGGLFVQNYQFLGYRLNVHVDFVSELHDATTRSYHIQTADVIIFTHEPSSEQSARSLVEFYRHVREIRQDKMPLLVVGTKSDLPGKSDNLQEELLVDAEIRGAKYITTSAKLNVNVDEMFEFCFRNVIRTLHTYSMAQQHEILSDVEQTARNVHHKRCFKKLFKKTRR